MPEANPCHCQCWPKCYIRMRTSHWHIRFKACHYPCRVWMALGLLEPRPDKWMERDNRNLLCTCATRSQCQSTRMSIFSCRWITYPPLSRSSYWAPTLFIVTRIDWMKPRTTAILDEEKMAHLLCSWTTRTWLWLFKHLLQMVVANWKTK